MGARAYSSTRVPAGRSQEDLRKMLLAKKADQFQVGEGRDWTGVEFIVEDVRVRFKVPIRPYDITQDTSHRSRAEKEATGDEHERDRVWRVLVHSVKARFVAALRLDGGGLRALGPGPS